ncbi:MAG: protein involved in sex pheromone biosynthesis [bacterium]|jgi:protein involved in sex pheromone biosynthesis
MKKFIIIFITSIFLFITMGCSSSAEDRARERQRQKTKERMKKARKAAIDRNTKKYQRREAEFKRRGYSR